MTDLQKNPTIRLHASDNVVVAREIVSIGLSVPTEGFTCRSQVPAGHKIAARDIEKGEAILKYNVCIGFAEVDISAGTYVHSHNTEFRDFDRDYAHARDYVKTPVLPAEQQATFEGIVRANGQVGTRNFIGILSTVNCSATVVHRIAEHFTADKLAAYPNVDGVVALSHGLGCGMEMSGEPMDLLRRTLGGFATHANFAGVLIVGLGCERNQLSELLKAQGLEAGPRLHTFVMQETGGTRKTIEAGVAAIETLLPEANNVKRQTLPASHLKVGLQCGGSDGFSSITANPALGAAMDILVRHGGTAILSETPEIYGVEHTLTRRARTPEVGQKLVKIIRWWKDEYSPGRDVQINGKVSPGNQMGGLANIFYEGWNNRVDGGVPLCRASDPAWICLYGYAWF
jgi:altronate hydrolase